MTEKEIEQQKREKLRKEKPLVLEKILKIEERFKKGIPTPIVDIAYNYACNLKCKHCTASRFKKDGRKLTPQDLRKISDECHQLGLCQFCISGGEPLLFKDLDEVITSLQPDKFHLTMSTNGHFMTKDMAKRLKTIGLDKVKISLDDFDEKKHNSNRNNDGAYQKAVNAMLNAKEAGLSVVIQAVVTHQNCQSDQTIQMAKFAKEHGFTVDVLIARATGEWEGKHDILIDEEDAKFLLNANKEYPVLHRDTFPSYGMDKGCGAVKACLHVTQFGDVLPCVYIHISIGNIFKESLKDIIDRGMKIKHFKEYNPKCLSGEDRNFIDNYMSKFYGKPLPVHYSKVFKKEDFLD
jgi:MoaA/NifB/PqqE/SkfB family radical SAM enzyme